MSAAHPSAEAPPAQRSYMTVWTVALLTAAAIVTSLRGLPLMAKEELTMFAYIAFATVLFLVPAALVSAELGSAFGDRKGGVYTWIGEAFGQRWGFVGIWLQWIQNVVWYPTALGFAAAAAAFTIGRSDLADEHIFVGLFCIGVYWLATLVALSGTALMAKVAKFGFVAGTAVPGIVLIGLFVYWVVSGHPIGWETAANPAVSEVVNGQPSPRWFPHVEGLGTLAFLGSILLLFAGVEVQAVHITDMKRPRSGFPRAMLIATVISVTIFTLGALAVAGILPYNQISLQSGVFDALNHVLDDTWNIGWMTQILSGLICYGALGGALAWLVGPSRGLLATAHDGELPPALQRTNAKGIQRNILLVQGAIVTLISCVYLVTKDVSNAFFLISAMTVSLYIIMYMLLYAAAIRLRITQPDLPRSFRVPGGMAGMWGVAGIGFLAVSFAFVLAFVPPSQLAVGSPAFYVALVASGTVIFTGLPLLIHHMRKPSWREGEPSQTQHEASFNAPAASAPPASTTGAAPT